MFFEKFGEYLNRDKFDECSFLYHLGVLRYSYYNKTNKEYQASGDGALFASLKYMTEEFISIYLKNDIDKYMEILEEVDAYVENNDYDFHSKNIDLEKYNELRYTELIKILRDDREQFEEEWSTERRQKISNLDKIIEEYNNLSDEEKEEFEAR